MMPPGWLTDLERALEEDSEGDSLPIAVVVLASVAGRAVPLDEPKARGARRRALLLLTAGGDPDRGLDLNGRAVGAIAADLEDPERRVALERGFGKLREEAAGLPYVSEAIHALLDAPDVAWRAYACSLLAEELAELE